MGLFDFFNKKKQESLRIEEEARLRKLEQERQERERQKRLEENRKKEAAERLAQKKAEREVNLSIDNVPQNIQDIIDAATLGLMAAQKGNSRLEQESLFNLFNLTQDKTSQVNYFIYLLINTIGWDLVFVSFWNTHKFKQMKTFLVLLQIMHSFVYQKPLSMPPETRLCI